jgi:DNA-binding GntR family transcriptional regulator
MSIRRGMDIFVPWGIIYRMQGFGSFISSISQITNPIADPFCSRI